MMAADDRICTERMIEASNKEVVAIIAMIII